MKLFTWLKETWTDASWLFKGACIAILLGILFTTGRAAFAVETGAYSDPEQPGHGIQILCNRQDLCVVYWFNYVNGEPIWLISDPLCKQGESCETGFFKPIGFWNATGGIDLGEQVGSAVIDVDNEILTIDYEAIDVRPEACSVGSGGLILRGCIGEITMRQFAR